MVEVLAILGGSSAFTPALATALAARAAHLPPLTIRLHGRDAARVGSVRDACLRVTAAAGAPHMWEATTSVEEAAADARIVVNQVRVGGFAGRAVDETFPLAFGIPGDETIGPAGLASAIRTVPVVMDLARRAVRVAPQAWFVNLTNPLGIVVAALRAVPGLRAFGLCELPGVTLAKALAIAGLNAAGVESDYVGLNHQGWFVGLRQAGRNVLPQVLAAVAARGTSSAFPVDGAVMLRERALPLPYQRLYEHTQREVAAATARGARTRAAELEAISEGLRAGYATAAAAPLPAPATQRDMPWLGEALVPAIEALLGGHEVDLYVTQANAGTLDFVPDDATVEMHATVGATGPRARPVRTPPPEAVRARIVGLARYEAAALCAALAPDHAHVVAALQLHPLTRGHARMDALAEAVLEAGGATPSQRAV